jgi:hypothetical protein
VRSAQSPHTARQDREIDAAPARVAVVEYSSISGVTFVAAAKWAMGCVAFLVCALVTHHLNPDFSLHPLEPGIDLALELLFADVDAPGALLGHACLDNRATRPAVAPALV